MYHNFFTDDEFSSPPLSIVTLPRGNESVKITISTKRDILIEDNESFNVTASPPGDANIQCRATVTILDNSKLCCVVTRYALIWYTGIFDTF